MKAIKLLTLLLSLTFAFSSTQATISRVQLKTANTAAATASTLNLVFDTTPTAGNTIVLAIATGLGIQNVTGTNVEFTYIERVTTNSCIVTLAVGRVFGSASATVTVTTVTATAIAIAGAEYTGSGMLRVDKQTTSSGSSTAPNTGTTATTTNAKELWVGALAHRNQNGDTFTSPTNSFSIVGQTSTTLNTAGNDRTAGLFEQIVSSTGTANAGATVSVTNNWAGAAATLEETPTSTAQTRIPSIGN